MILGSGWIFRACLPSTNPAHADAIELARTLRSRGLVMKCVLPSVEERMFEGQGAANCHRYRRLRGAIPAETGKLQ